jgi:hypothetical protein
LSGAQVAIVEELADPKVLALQTDLAAASEVIFPAINVPVASREWIFIPGDTSAQPLTPVPGALAIPECNNSLRCKYTVTVSGRMHLRLPDGISSHVTYPSPVIWVGRNPQYRLTLQCAPVFVHANKATKCEAVSAAGDTLEVRHWFWDKLVGKETSVLEQCMQTGIYCRKVITEAGKMYVRAFLDGIEQTAQARIDLAPPGCPVGDSITWAGCHTLNPEQVDSIRTAVHKYYFPGKDTIPKCAEIHQKLLEWLTSGAIYVYNSAGKDTIAGPLLGEVQYADGFDPPRYVVGIRKERFLSENKLARTAFHEAAHLAGVSDEAPIYNASYYEDACYWKQT